MNKILKNINTAIFVLTITLAGIAHADDVTIQLGSGDGFKVLDSSGSPLMDILSNGKVGIGTSPNYKLDVSGDINFTGSLYQNGSTFSGSAWTTSNSDIYYNSGKVGIGITSPGEKLSVAGTIESTSGGIKFPDGTTQVTAGGGIPTGGIIMWSGTLASVPAGWALCDGASGTPDLRNRFIYGWTTGVNPGATGGSNSYSLTEAQMPGHTHAFTTNTDAAHAHSIWTTNGPTSTGAGIPIRGVPSSGAGSTTGTDGAHAHSGATNPAGSNASIDNRPAFYTLAYIMKL